MLILGIDTSASVCCSALFDAEKQTVLAQSYIDNKLTHSVTLMPLVNDMLKNCGVRTDEIDLFACAVGPGSFTGLRIGISAVKGMAFAANKPCAAVTACEGMAYNLALAGEAVVCAAIDARCNQAFYALFEITDGIVSRLCAEECLTADEIAQRLLPYRKRRIILAGDAAALISQSAENIGLRVETAPAPQRFQSAAGICIAAQYAKQIPANELMPMYLKLPQAQRELMARQAAQKI